MPSITPHAREPSDAGVCAVLSRLLPRGKWPQPMQLQRETGPGHTATPAELAGVRTLGVGTGGRGPCARRRVPA